MQAYKSSVRSSLESFDRVPYLCLVSSLLIDSVMRLFPFLGTLHLGRDCANLNLLKVRGEAVVEREGVSRINISAWRVLLQDLVLGAS